MAVEAALEHKLNGRLRVRVRAKRRDSAYFAELERKLRECEGVEDIKVNELTGSVFVLHHTTPDAVLAFARDRGLFRISERAERPQPVTEKVVERLARMDERLNAISEGRINLASTAAFGVAAVGVLQVLRRHTWPAAFTLFWYAAALSRIRFVSLSGNSSSQR
ncbi:MAG: hypothetical protein IRZ15_04655 [Bryobacteraceae bacterium]|nr:hypothetical protein [Bryobacteraceae bacterium]